MICVYIHELFKIKIEIEGRHIILIYATTTVNNNLTDLKTQEYFLLNKTTTDLSLNFAISEYI